MMKENVLIVLSSLAVNNGVASCIMNYYNSVIEKGYHVDFLVLKRANSERETYAEKKGSKIYLLPKSEKIVSKEKNDFLGSLIKNNRYTIVHVNIPYHNGVAVLKAAKSSGVPVRIYHIHCPKREDSLKTKLKSDIYTPRCVNNATDYLSCSHLAASTLFGKKKYCVLHNAIDAQKYVFNEEKRAQLRGAYSIDNAFVVGAVCRIDKLKNPFFLVDTFSEIKKREPNAKLVWLGSGDLDEEVKQYANKKGLKDDCIFLGSRTDVNNWYSAMDVLLFPSTLEGLGMVLIEAQASGLMCYTSKNVSKETDLTGLVHYADLNEGASKWAETILKQAKDYRRVSRIKEVTEAGYNIASLKDDLGSIYGQYVRLKYKENN